MADDRVALYIAVLVVAIAVAFVGYAASGADLCVWCPLLGR